MTRLTELPSPCGPNTNAANHPTQSSFATDIGRILRRSILSLALLIISGLGVFARADGFVTAHNSQFMLSGKPFYVTGVNSFYVVWASDAELDRVLDAAVAMGANVMRTALAPVIGAPGGGTPPTIWKFNNSQASSYDLNTHGVYVLYWNPATKAMAINGGPDGFGKIDRLVAAAAKRHIKLLITLMDYWSFIGGVPQMDAWYGSTDHTGFFFEDPRAIADYKTWVRYVIDHVNPLTGVRYRDDPTIFGWELMNESHANLALRRPWTETMSTYIKSLDPHHLVSSGEDYLSRDEFSIPSIDFVTWHGYPKYYAITPAAMDGLIKSYCGLADKFHKPVVLEEFGYAGNSKDPTQAQVYRTWLKTLAGDPNCAGWLVWSLVGRQDSGRYPDDTGEWFDIRDDGGATWTVLSNAAHRGRQYSETAATSKP